MSPQLRCQRRVVRPEPRQKLIRQGELVRRIVDVLESAGRAQSDDPGVCQRTRSRRKKSRDLLRRCRLPLELTGSYQVIEGRAHSASAARLRLSESAFDVEGTELHITMRGGIAVSPHDGEDASLLLRNAEAALKKAKLSGVPYLFYQSGMTMRTAQTLALESRLRQAIKLEQFELYYQPKIASQSGRVTGLEALLRWNDPDRGLTSPRAFIPLLEETGLIAEVGEWVLRQAFAQARCWHGEGIEGMRIAVNISSRQLRDSDFVAMVGRIVARQDSGPSLLELEITESTIMDSVDENVGKLKSIRGLGVEIAIDDFGTGYSSLAYLARLPVGTLKIDRSFIASMTRTPDAATIISTIISLAHAMNLKVVAEGVETGEQAEFLRLLNCDALQGDYACKPLPSGLAGAFLRADAAQAGKIKALPFVGRKAVAAA